MAGAPARGGCEPQEQREFAFANEVTLLTCPSNCFCAQRGVTALMEACQSGSLDLVQFLVSVAGADIHARNVRKYCIGDVVVPYF